MKIRTDFVTNSSSSSFVVYHFSSKDLVDYVKELIASGKTSDSLYHPDFGTIWGYEACEKLELNSSLDITLQIGQMRAAPFSLKVYRAEQTGNYSETSLVADCLKMLDKPIVLAAIESFFDLSKENKEQLNSLTEKAISNDAVSCGVFVDETDGFTGYLGKKYSLGELQAKKKDKSMPPSPNKNNAMLPFGSKSYEKLNEKIEESFKYDGVTFLVSFDSKQSIKLLDDWKNAYESDTSKGLNYKFSPISFEEAERKYSDFLDVCAVYVKRELLEEVLKTAERNNDGSLAIKRVQHLASTGFFAVYKGYFQILELRTVNVSASTMKLEIYASKDCSKYKNSESNSEILARYQSCTD